MTIGSLFSGVGGLELGLERATGQGVAWQCEYDKDASVVLAERWPGVPNLHDITAVDWADVEPVEIVCGGFPCQPFSSAGRRKGTADERWMWPEFARCVRALRPRYVVVENVGSLIADSGAFGSVLGDLAEAGYDARWTCLRAADVGAPHRRERLFLVAANSGAGAEYGERPRSEPRQGGRSAANASSPGAGRDTGAPPVAEEPARWGEPDNTDTPFAGGAAAPDAHSRRQQGGPEFDCDAQRTTSDGHPRRGHVDRRRDVDWGRYGPAVARWETIHGPAPAPVDDRGRLSPAFVEWMQGFPPGWVTDAPISRSAQLRCLGNAVVPACAEAAWHLLAPAPALV